MSNYAPGDLVQFRHNRQTLQGTIKAIKRGFTTCLGDVSTQVTIELAWTDLGGKEHHTEVTVPYGALAGRCRVKHEGEQ